MEVPGWKPLQYPHLIPLEGNFIRLEPLDKSEHANGLCDIFLASDAEERFRYSVRHPYKTREEIYSWLDAIKPDALIYVIVDKKLDKVVGKLELVDPVLEFGSVELWVYFSVLLARKPGGTEALFLLANYVFEELGFRRLEWNCDNRHEASKKAALRFGFVYETLWHQAWIHKNSSCDSVWYSIIDKDWPLTKFSCQKWLAPENFDENAVQRMRLENIRGLNRPKTVDPTPPSLSAKESKINARNFDANQWKICDKPSHKVIEGRFVRLEPLEALKHGDALYELAIKEPGRFDYLPELPPRDRAEFQVWLTKSEKSVDPLYFTIVDKASGRISGRQTFSRIKNQHGCIELGHIFWSSLIARKPAATEACYLFAKHVFDDLNYRRFEWKCNSLNRASWNSALRFGFRYEGIFRQMRVRKGCTMDVVWLAMLDRDWHIVKRSFEKWLAPENFDENGVQKERMVDIRNRLIEQTFKN